ncbi:hypothetical protein [Mycolicibacterium mageritense]|uniref:hypothetical protein n=1 Tax=Mycolicibacterium mageritense TaxID=53462 RepID=UPI001E292E0F|nr:hypothetical protein [Mycolicibacterium mageritense]
MRADNIDDSVLATFDWPDRGRVWSGRMRIGDNGDVVAIPEWEFIEKVGYALYTESGVVEEAPRADVHRCSTADPWSDGWIPGTWWRVLLSDGSVWSESSDEAENRAKLAEIRANAITVYPPGHPEGKVSGPDSGAKLQRMYTRSEQEWRETGD